MNEEERAKRLSDAIDAILQGGEPELGLDDDDLIELLRIARLRHRAGEALADVGLAYQELLRRVLQARMVARQMEHETEADTPPPEASEPLDYDVGEFLDPLDPDRGKLLNFLDFRPRTTQSQPSAGVAMQIKPSSETPTAVSPPDPESQQVVHLPGRPARVSEKRRAQALDAVLEELRSSPKAAPAVEDPDLTELVEVARLRQCVGQSLAAAGTPYKRRLWTMLRLRLAASLRRRSYRREGYPIITAVGQWGWQRAAAAAAVIALLLAAVGPLPATGLAHHPIGNFFNFVSQRVGVEEVDGPPPTQVPTWYPKQAITAQEAQGLLGLPVSEPSYLPNGFARASSLYYSESYSSPEQGMFVLTYTLSGVDPAAVPIDEPILMVYQEQATGDSVAVQTGQAEDVTLAANVPATYAYGVWSPDVDGSLQWTDTDTERLIFEDGEVRTIIVYRNVENAKDELVRIAESMLLQ
jgi:hypothetical protein